MPPKKAAKKAAKKGAAKHGPHEAAKDARRTFEHLGRVQALSRLTVSEIEALTLLTDLADEAFHSQKFEHSADLLRAAEHLSFASLHARSAEEVTAELQEAIVEEIERLLERMERHAAEHGSPRTVQKLRLRLHRETKEALQRGSYRAALEFARAAEALAHIRNLDPTLLAAAPSQKRLRD